MLSSASGTSSSQPLQSPQINNERNNGLIGGGSNNIVTVNSGNVIIQINDSEDELDRLLGRHLSKDALNNSFYSPPGCHPNTRTTVRNEVGEWMDESGSEKSPFLWLNGPAGVGKSAIAKTISVLQDQVVATFFFSTSADRSATTLFPTLAWQLARRIPETREYIIASLKNSGSLQTSQIEEQFDLLILRPLKSTTTLRCRPVMIIDGVDECIDESMLVRFLRALVRAGEDGGMPVRFMICSRPEPRIRAILGRAHTSNPIVDEQEQKLHSLLDKIKYFVWGLAEPFDPRSEHVYNQPGQGFAKFLQDVRELYRPIRLGFDNHAPSFSGLADTLDIICPHPVVSTIQIGFSEECKQDIAKYLTDTFNAISQPEGCTSPWFRPRNISDLVEASCGQFLYASTIARLLDEPHFDPRDIFEMARRGSLPTPDLNKLYKAILKRAEDTMRNQAQDGGPDYHMEWRFVMDSLRILVFLVGNVHFFTVSNTFPVIEGLLGLESGKLTRKLSKMHSVLNIDPGLSIRIYHRSFLEFLQSRERSGEYHIPYSTALQRILILLFRVGLRYNIFKDKDSRWHSIEDMAVACRRNVFGRSKFPFLLHLFHIFIYFIMTVVIVNASTMPMLMFLPYSVRSHLYVVVVFLCLLFTTHFLVLCISFILSLTTYTFFFNRSIVIPFFHPFLHLLFILTSGFLVPSKLLFFLLIASISPLLLMITGYILRNK